MSEASLEPTTTYLRLDERTPLDCRSDNRFTISHVESTGRMAEQVQKSSSVPALLVSMSLRSLAAGDYRLWVDGKLVPTRGVPAFRTNIIDLATEPQIWAGSALDYVHFHVRRSAIDDTATDLGYERVGAFRLSVVEEDIVLARITKSILPHVGRANGQYPFALDDLELILAAHLLQRYSAVRRRRAVVGGALAEWQRRRAEDLLRENLDGQLRLADLARECNLSVSHFARSFKTSFGVSAHRWLMDRRIERAQELLGRTGMPLVDVAFHSGFGDQAAFTRTFHRLVGVTPGRWRREHATGQTR